MIRVVLVDDQMLVRSGIRGLLELTPDIRVVAEAADGAQAPAVIAAAQADVLLLDVRMPHCSGIELLQRHAAQLPPAILLTTFDDDAALFDGMRAGAKGFLLKDISLERLAEGIRSVAAGATLFRPALTERTRAAFASAAQAPSTLAERLTARETEILALMAAGFNNGEIAAALGPSEGTIKNHVSNILAKLAVRDRVRAVLRGLELGYI
ncbi:MAG: response regulator transcription factor [Pseudomonadota bacterium]|nr:response regulator transcription factor [Pseudomonadota bacterium]